MGGVLQFAALAPDPERGGASVSASTSSTLKLFQGDALKAVLETAETQITEGQRTELYLMKPVVTGNASTVPPAEATAMTMQIGTRNIQTEVTGFTDLLPVNSIGMVPCRSNARYHRLRVNIEKGFEDAIGVEVLETLPGGYR